MDEVKGSSPFSSTQNGHLDLRLGHFLGGFVAGEGWFTVTRRLPPFADGAPRLRFVFGVSVASRDRPILEDLRGFLGYGSIHEVAPRNPAHLPISTLAVASLRAHRGATIPFAERYLPASAKRRQYELWRQALESYVTQRPARRGRSSCSEAGCGRPVRGRGLCRTHYYRATGY
jgi:hypothetical protein